MLYLLPKEALKGWLEKLKETYQVFVPSSPEGFGPYQGELYLKGKTKLSAKEFFLPWREPILAFEARPSATPRVLTPPEEKRIVFGVRPCDAKGLTLIEKVFRNDPFFRARQERTFLFGLLCREPGAECFGWAMGVDPFAGEGLGALFWETEETFLVKVVEAQVEPLFQEGPFEKAGPEQEALWEEARKKFLEKHPLSPALEKLKGAELLKLYEAPFWEELALACLNCGTCTFLCPTCYCFDVQDEVVGTEGVRVRLPEACMFEIYSRHASGHNPRRSPVARFRNRFLHKFKYFLDQYGEPLCVGCGRCNEECPAGINLWEVIRAMSTV